MIIEGPIGKVYESIWQIWKGDYMIAYKDYASINYSKREKRKVLPDQPIHCQGIAGKIRTYWGQARL